MCRHPRSHWFVVSLWLASAVAWADVVKPGSSTVFYANLLEEAEEQSLVVKASLVDTKSAVQRDTFIYQQDKQLFGQMAVSEEEFRQAEWHLDRDKAKQIEAEQKVQQAEINVAIYKLYLAWAQGQTQDTVLLARFNEQLWQERVDIAQTQERLAQVDETYARWHYQLIERLADQSVESKTALVQEKAILAEKENAFDLAKQLRKHVESAHQRAVDELAQASGNNKRKAG